MSWPYTYRRADTSASTGWVREAPGDNRSTHCAGQGDDSPLVPYERKNSLRCGWCYLNVPHTQAAHDAEAESKLRG